MNQRLLTTVAVFGLLSGFANFAHAADLIEEPAYAPPPPPVEIVSTAGWYLRGDAGYVFSSSTDGEYGYRTADYSTHPYTPFTEYYHYSDIDTDSAFLVGGGIGYRLNDFARFDVTADYFSSDLKGSSNCVGYSFGSCHYDDSSSTDIWTVMANAYVDFYRSGRFSTYVGAGAGGAYVDYDQLNNKFVCRDPSAAVNCGLTFKHEGYSDWRFAASLMAGVTYDITDHFKFDAGYRYTRIASGDAFGYDAQDIADGASGVQGRDHGFDLHAIRAGVRYEFGGGGFGKGKEPVYAEPAPLYQEPVYK